MVTSKSSLYCPAFILVLVFVMDPSAVLAQHTGGSQGVRIEASDGMSLGGRYYPAAEPGPGVLLLHQCDREGMPTGYERLAGLLSDAGFHVLTFDFRGYGGSRNERFTGQNWQEAGAYFETDTEAAFQFLSSRSGVIKSTMGVLGASCGGRQAILLSWKHREIRSLVLLSGSIRAPIDPALQALKDRPVLTIAAEADSSAARAMKRAFDASPSPLSRMIVYKGSAHGTPLFAHDLRLESSIVEWFMTHLRNP